MTKFKAASIALVLAIANPLCCCFAGISFSEPDTSSENQSPSTYGCCSTSSKEAEKPNSATTHSRDTCPHDQERDSQIAEAPDAVRPTLAAAFLVNPFAILPPSVHSPVNTESSHSERALAFAIPKPVETYSQTYCVYTI